MKMLLRRFSSGVTIIELMLVIAVIGVITVVAVNSQKGMPDKTKASKAIFEIQQLLLASRNYFRETTREWPPELTPSYLSTYVPANLASGNQYQNPWGNPYEIAEFDTTELNQKSRVIKTVVPSRKVANEIKTYFAFTKVDDDCTTNCDIEIPISVPSEVSWHAHIPKIVAIKNVAINDVIDDADPAVKDYLIESNSLQRSKCPGGGYAELFYGFGATAFHEQSNRQVMSVENAGIDFVHLVWMYDAEDFENPNLYKMLISTEGGFQQTEGHDKSLKSGSQIRVRAPNALVIEFCQ